MIDYVLNSDRLPSWSGVFLYLFSLETLNKVLFCVHFLCFGLFLTFLHSVPVQSGRVHDN